MKGAGRNVTIRPKSSKIIVRIKSNIQNYILIFISHHDNILKGEFQICLCMDFLQIFEIICTRPSNYTNNFVFTSKNCESQESSLMYTGLKVYLSQNLSV